MRIFEFVREPLIVMIDFKGNHFPKSVILFAVFSYVRYGVSYQDLVEIMAEPLGGEILSTDRRKRAGQNETDSCLLAYGRDLYQGAWSVDVLVSRG